MTALANDSPAGLKPIALRDVELDLLVYVWDPRVGFGHGGTGGSGRRPAG